MNNYISENERKHTSQNPLRQLAIKEFFNNINRLFPSVNNVLDAGCGEGYDASKIMEEHPNIEMFGVDLSMKSVAKSRKICPAMYPVKASVLDLPYPDNTFDLVISLEVLEHLEYPSIAIEEYIKVSRKYILLSVPNEPIFRMLRMMGGMDILQFGNHPEHIQHWNIFTFKDFLRSHGLKIVDSAVPIPYIWSIVLCELPQ